MERETADLKQAEQHYRSAKDEAAAARAELDRTRSTLQSNSELVTRLKASVRAADETAEAKQAELEQARTVLQQSEQKIQRQQSDLEAAARAENKAVAAVQTQLEAAQATIANLKVRLEGAMRLAAAAGAARAAEMEAARPEPRALAGESEHVTSSNPPAATLDSAAVAEPKSDSLPPPMAEAPSLEAMPLPSQSTAESKPLEVSRRRKSRRENNQMDLFGTQPAADESQTRPDTDGAAEQAVVEPVSLPQAEPLPALAASVSEEAGEQAVATEKVLTATKTATKPKDEKPTHALPAPPPVNPAELRKAVNLIWPLFAGQDPGARDCLKANRTTFRSAFSPEAYVEFEQLVKGGDFTTALEHLKKAARRHGISV